MGADDDDRPTEEVTTLSPALAPTDVDLPSGGGRPGPGRKLGRYELREQLGAGGMGVVYRAIDPTLHRDVAIKVIRPVFRSSQAREQLLREARAMAALEHPNVVPIFDVGVTGEDVFLAMPLLAGGSLGDWLRAESRPWQEVLERFVAAGRGLAAAHGKGLIHRDFKPDNVLLGEDGVPRVADFGMALQAAEDDRGQVSRRGGTPGYMAPEQLTALTVDARSDQYAFCVSLWEGLSGKRPPELAQDPADLPEPVPGPGGVVPAWLRSAVARGLQVDPLDRWPSIAALLDHCQARLRRPARRAVLAGGALLVAAGASTVVLLGAGSTHDAPASVVYREDRLLVAPTFDDAELSPDGARVAMIVDGQLIVRELNGAPEIILGDLGNAAAVAWSPRGDRIAIADPGGPTRIATVDGKIVRELAFSARHVAFLGDDAVAVADEGPALTVVDAEGSPRACALGAQVRGVLGLAGDSAGGAIAVVELAGAERALLRIERMCRLVREVSRGEWLSAVARGDRILGLRRHSYSGPGVDAQVALVLLDEHGTVLDEKAATEFRTLVALGADGSQYLTRERDEWRLIEVGTGAVIASGRGPTELAVSHDGQLATIEDWNRRVLSIVRRPGSDAPSAILSGGMTMAWSGASDRLAVIVDAPGGVELRLMDPLGTVLKRWPLARPELDLEDHISWLGNDAVVLTGRGDGLFRIDLATGALTTVLAEGTFYGLVGTGDGRLLFRRDLGGDSLWVRDPDGTLTRLPAIDQPRLSATWAADATSVIIYARGSGSMWKVVPGSDVARPMPSLTLEAEETLVWLWPLSDQRLLAGITRGGMELLARRPQ